MVPMEWEVFRENATRVIRTCYPTTLPLSVSRRGLTSRTPQMLGGVTLTKKHKLSPLVYIENPDGADGTTSLLFLSMQIV